MRIPVEGRLWILTSALLLATGIYKSINLITLLACAMAVIWVMNAIGIRRRLRHIRLVRRVAQPLFAGERGQVEIRLSQTAKREVLGLRVEDRGTSHSWREFVPSLSGYENLPLHYAFLPLRRGDYQLEPPRIASGFPFGLIEGIAIHQPGESLVVLPALGRLNLSQFWRFLHHTSVSAGRSRRRPVRLPNAQSEAHGIRTFRDGDSPRWIHWRTTARRSELMVREFEETPADELIVVVDLSADAERCISLAATICWSVARQSGDPIALLIAGPKPTAISGSIGSGHAIRLLECLARARVGPVPDNEDWANAAARLRPSAASIVAIGAKPNQLKTDLIKRWQRPVAALDVTALDKYDFYERPRIHAA